MLSKAALSIYQQASRGDATGYKSPGHHSRRSRGFVDVKKGPYNFRYLPLKDCCSIVGVTQQCLRNWIKGRLITPTVLFRMHTFCKPELLAIKRINDRFRPGVKKHTEPTPEFIKALSQELSNVRYAIDKCVKGHKLTELDKTLLLFS